MRILYVINGFDPGGAEHGLLTLIRGGFFSDHELFIFGFCRGQGSLADLVEAEVPNGHFLLSSDASRLSVVALLKGAFRFAGLVRECRPHMVVLSLKQANIVGRFVLSFFPKVYCVSFEHIARYRASRLEGLYGPLLRFLSYRVDEVWADCLQTLGETRRYFSPRRRPSHPVPLFSVDAGLPAKSDYAAHRPLRLVAAGRLTARKNFALLLEAVARLKASLDLALDIYGDGEERPALERQATQKGLGSHVRFRGYQADWATLPAVLEADLFVNVSHTEGFCIVVAEAMAAGLPAIATDVGGIREYGRDGENILKLADTDVDRLVAAVAALADDEARRRRLGEAARADMMRSYGPGIFREKGRELLSDRSRGATTA